MNLTSSLIIAPPSVTDNFWYKTVIMITEHHPRGSIGLILNKKSSVSITDFADRLGLYIDLPGFVYIGGPVNPTSLSIIHTPDWATTNSMKINKHFSLSSSADMLPRFAEGDCPSRWRIFSGMCSWMPAQLENEIHGNPPYHHNTSWCLAQSDQSLVFDNDLSDQWTTAITQSGIEFARNILA